MGFASFFVFVTIVVVVVVAVVLGFSSKDFFGVLSYV
jgi:hypothetical protein